MASKLIKDLSHVPNIIAGLGLGIADAQAHFDHEYLRSLERIAVLAQSMLGKVPAGNDQKEKERNEALAVFVKEMLLALAPARYQFTETTLAVRLDLAQSLAVSAQGGLSAGVGAVAVNASLAVGFKYDYRAAAECRTVLHAVPANPAAMATLLARATELAGKDLTLPPRPDLDKDVEKAAGDVFERLFGTKPAEIKDKPATPGNNPAPNG